MISSLEHTSLIAAVSFLNIELYFCACGRAEYEINGECCPMCPPGNRVYRHCTEFTSTTCMPCVGSTYTDEPNGLSNCLSCTVCDVGQGLKVKMACTWTSDTVCEPLEGFYCTDNYRDKCIFARQHTQCNPGEYIKQEVCLQEQQLKILNVHCVQMEPTPMAPFTFVNNIQSECLSRVSKRS
ncbi:tumor necrosis factor receptor superfamily member 14-like isoform X2 [Silurus meridionalis]|uniref:tumor necrosis factor receptor superfamily member 14-like isoform X2 n=1 Tax=Silurus meridionalis TaxID=175797 RepID=UPI001EEADCE1|nr:tumor necrosis factor receptor superfamily member 14-like isoform X2 [Silurus meridionalis]